MSEDFILDLSRTERIGLDEAIFCAGKTIEQITAIIDRMIGARLLLTRLDGTQFAALPEDRRVLLDYEPLSRTAILGAPAPLRSAPPVAVVMAGTSDLPVGREAVRTLAYHGQGYEEHVDVGVAGLWRLMQRIEAIRRAPVVIVVAGMDAALISVVGGLVPGLVIGLPTSVGYGVAAGGTAALHAALASCAPGVTVVNIDNGYGAACAALRAMNSATCAP
jgi:NCAIR mutase (PurE)-related protein